MTWWLFFYNKNQKGRKSHDFRVIDPLQGVHCKFIETKSLKWLQKYGPEEKNCEPYEYQCESIKYDRY